MYFSFKKSLYIKLWFHHLFGKIHFTDWLIEISKIVILKKSIDNKLLSKFPSNIYTMKNVFLKD